MTEPTAGEEASTIPARANLPPGGSLQAQDNPHKYRLYKRRFVGVVGLFLLNVVAAMAWPWFGPISNKMVDEFGVTLDQVNWLGNIVGFIYLPTAIVIPSFCARYGIRRCCDIGVVCLILASWIRFAGTAHGLGTNQAYGLLIFGQFFTSIAQPIFQILGPAYSETWFDLKGRTTATMVIAISNPIGGALGQLLSPIFSTTRQSILVLGIIATAATPVVYLIRNAPPTPPTHAGSKKQSSLLPLLRAMAGLESTTSESFMSKRERWDFAIIIAIFGVLSAGTNTIAILSAQVFGPYGYNDTTSGLMGAVLLLAGIIAAVITAPLFDRVFTHHLAITSKVLVPCTGFAWLGLIRAVRPNNTAPLFVLMGFIGACTITMLPVGLELACELTRNADGSSAVLWFIGNLVSVTFVLSQGALRAGPNASPPLNMHRALIFNGVVIIVPCMFVFLLRGRQARKEMDESKIREQASERGNVTLGERR